MPSVEEGVERPTVNGFRAGRKSMTGALCAASRRQRISKLSAGRSPGRLAHEDRWPRTFLAGQSIRPRRLVEMIRLLHRVDRLLDVRDLRSPP
jgi:hypothetical protein